MVFIEGLIIILFCTTVLFSFRQNASFLSLVFAFESLLNSVAPSARLEGRNLIRRLQRRACRFLRPGSRWPAAIICPWLRHKSQRQVVRFHDQADASRFPMQSSAKSYSQHLFRAHLAPLCWIIQQCCRVSGEFCSESIGLVLDFRVNPGCEIGKVAALVFVCDRPTSPRFWSFFEWFVPPAVLRYSSSLRRFLDFNDVPIC